MVRVPVANEDTGPIKIIDIYITSSYLNHISDDRLDDISDNSLEKYLYGQAKIFIQDRAEITKKIFKIVLLIDELPIKIAKIDYAIGYLSSLKSLNKLDKNAPAVHFISDIVVKPLACYIKQDPFSTNLSKKLRENGLSKNCIDLSLPITCTSLLHFDKQKKELVDVAISSINAGCVKTYMEDKQKKFAIKNMRFNQKATFDIKYILILSSCINMSETYDLKNTIESSILQINKNFIEIIPFTILILLDEFLQKGSIAKLKEVIKQLNKSIALGSITNPSIKINDIIIKPDSSYLQKNPNLQMLFANVESEGLSADCVKPYLRIDYSAPQAEGTNLKHKAPISWTELILEEKSNKRQCTNWEARR